MVFVTNIAVNIEHKIPVLKVIANPFIGPEPIQANTKAAIKVVKFASRIVKNALSYPEYIADLIALPRFNSSRIRSKIITFASTDMPIVNIKPAIPGRVKDAPTAARIAITIIKFNNIAKLASNPAPL